MGEINGIGKEQSDNYCDYEKLILEGKNLNGKRIEYNYDYSEECYKIIYETEYLKGERHGNGKEHDYSNFHKYQ